MEQSLCVYIIMHHEGKVGVQKPQSWCWVLFVNPLSSPPKIVYKGTKFRKFFFNIYKSWVESMPKIIDEKFIAWAQPSHINFLLQIGLWNLNKICQFIVQYYPPPPPKNPTKPHDMNRKFNLCTSVRCWAGSGGEGPHFTHHRSGSPALLIWHRWSFCFSTKPESPLLFKG